MNERGHTFVELLVAMALLALLAAAFLRWLGPALGALARAGAGAGAQRSLRRAQEALRSDLREAGFAVPWPGRLPPGPAVAVPGPGILALRGDGVVPGRACLGAATDGSPVVRVAAERGARLEGGEVLVLEDGAWEAIPLAGPQVLPAGQGTPVRLATAPGGHGAGTGLIWVRPDRTVTYRLGPGGLLRQEGGRSGVAAPGITAFHPRLRPGGEGRPSLVEVELEARGVLGPVAVRRRARLACAPRGAGGFP